MRIMNQIIQTIFEKIFEVYVLFVGLTSKMTYEGNLPLTEIIANSSKALYAFWHNRIFYFLYLFRKSRIAIPISTHKDGAAIARVAQKFGFNVIPGSSTRGSISVLTGILDFLSSNHAVSITPDGPRGPKYSIQDGILFAAYKSKTPMRAAVWHAKHVIIFKSWDSFILPLPFNSFHIIISDPIEVNSKDDIPPKKTDFKNIIG